LADILALEEAIGDKFASTGAMAASVRHQYAVSMSQEEFGIAQRTESIVPEAMQHDDRAAVALGGKNIPSPEDDVVLRCDRNRLQVKTLVNRQLSNLFFLSWQ
jgi:hypothetical protein